MNECSFRSNSLKLWFRTFLLLFFAAGMADAAPKQFYLQKDQSQLIFQTLLGGSVSKGEFVNYGGVFWIDTEDLTRSKVSLSIDTASFKTNAPFAAEIVSKKDMLWVTRYPSAQYEVTKIALADDGATIVGLLTIRGIEKPIVAKGVISHDSDSDVITVAMSGSFKRSDFGLTALPKMISDDVQFLIKLRLVKGK